MSFLKINKTDLTSTVDKIKEEIKTSQDDLTSISEWCTNNIKTVPIYYSFIISKVVPSLVSISLIP